MGRPSLHTFQDRRETCRSMGLFCFEEGGYRTARASSTRLSEENWIWTRPATCNLFLNLVLITELHLFHQIKYKIIRANWMWIRLSIWLSTSKSRHQIQIYQRKIIYELHVDYMATVVCICTKLPRHWHQIPGDYWENWVWTRQSSTFVYRTTSLTSTDKIIIRVRMDTNIHICIFACRNCLFTFLVLLEKKSCVNDRTGVITYIWNLWINLSLEFFKFGS